MRTATYSVVINTLTTEARVAEVERLTVELAQDLAAAVAPAAVTVSAHVAGSPPIRLWDENTFTEAEVQAVIDSEEE